MAELMRRMRILGAASLAAALVVSGLASGASAAPIAHPSLVPETPARGYPIILGTPQYTTTNENCPAGCTLNREAFAVHQAGRFIVAGGNFYEIELADGSVVQQKYFAAWNIDTKAFACAGAFTFNGIVRSIEPAATAGRAYVGGDFTKITGSDGVVRTRNKVALLDLTTCTINTTFASTGADGKINEIVLSGSRLFVGGDFTTIGGQPVKYVAELDASTGATKPAFKFTFGSTTLASKIRGMGVSPDGTRLLFGGRFGTVSDGQRTLTTQTVIADISNPNAAPVLRNHTFVQTHPEYGTRPQGQSLQDVAISPDASYFALAYGTATVSDFAYVVNAVDGSQPVRWRHAMGDSSTGIAVSNNAVYVLGHFCKIATGPGATTTMSPKMGLDTCSGSSDIPAGAWRSHFAALSPTDGTPQTWNPGVESFFGGQVVTVTTRGVLIGFDGQRANSIRTGSVAFFDFGPTIEDTTAPGLVAFTAPAANATVNNPAVLTGSATDNIAVVSYKVRVQHSDGRWVQADGSLSTTTYQFSTPALADGTFRLSVTMPAGNYTAGAKAVDVAGLLSASWGTRKFVQSGIEGVAPQSTIVVNPATPIAADTTIALAGRATDNVAVSTITARITNSAGLYLQPDRTLAAAAVDYPLTVGTLNAPTVDWSADLGNRIPVGTYTVALTVKDPSGNVAQPTLPFTVTATPPAVAATSPAAKVLATAVVNVAGTVTDAGAVTSVTAQIKNSAGLFLQDDSTFAAAANDLNITVTGLNSASATYSFATSAPLPLGDHVLTVVAADATGSVATTTRNFSVVTRLDAPAVTAYTGFSQGGVLFGQTLGFTFKVNAAAQVTALGVQDTNANGVLNNTGDSLVGLWRASDQVLLGTVNVPKGTAVDAGWFYASLATPITLQPGVTYVLGQLILPGGEPAAQNGTVTEAANFDYVGPASAFTAGLGYPWFQVAGAGGSGMPNLKIV